MNYHMTVDELVSKILDAIDTSDGYNSYSVGFRNGLRYAKSLIDGEEPKYESCSYVNFITRKPYKEESEEVKRV